MLKSEIAIELRQRQEDQNNAFRHYETLGMDSKAALHAEESQKWEWLADLVESHVEDFDDADIITGEDVPTENPFSVIESPALSVTNLPIPIEVITAADLIIANREVVKNRTGDTCTITNARPDFLYAYKNTALIYQKNLKTGEVTR